MILSFRKLLLLYFLILPAFLFAQTNLKYSANFKNLPITAALQELEANYPISFSFDDQLLEDILVSTRFKNQTLERAMSQLFKNTGLDFEIVDGIYILIKNGKIEENPEPSPLPQLTICGQLLDKETGDPLISATVYIKNSSFGAYSDTSGVFYLIGSFSESDTVVLSYMGYGAILKPVSQLLKKPCKSIELAPSLNWMSDVLVKDFSIDMIGLGEKGNFHFKKEKIPTLPGWGEPDVMRMLQLLPGIGSAEESAARLNVRGGSPDQNLVLWEGIPIYHTGHFFGLYDAFNPYVVSEVDVWRGNFETEYGGRNSSVIDITGRPNFVDESTWGFGFNLLHINGFMEKPMFRKSKHKHKKGAVLVAFRQSWVDAINSSTYEKLFNQVFQNGRVAIQEQAGLEDKHAFWNPSIDYSDFNVKFRWQNRRQNENSISLYNNSDRLDYIFSYDDSISYFRTFDNITASNFGLSWQHKAKWSDRLSADYKVALSAYNNDYTFTWNEGARDQPYLYRYTTDNVLGDFSVKLHHRFQVTENKHFTFGYHFSGQQSYLLFSDTNTVKMEANVLSQDTSTIGLHTFYGSYNSMLGDRFSYSLGLRVNLFPLRGIYYSEPRINATWQSNIEGLSVKASMGRNWQFAFQILDFGDLGVGEPLWALAKEEIPAQELWQWTVGMQYEQKSMLLDVEAYHKRGSNLTSLNLRVDRGFERPWSFDGSSKASGIDFLFRKRLPPYSIWLAYSWGKVDLIFSEFNNGLPYPARHDIRHQVNWVNMLTLGKWDISANLHFRTGSPFSQPSVDQAVCETCTVSDSTYVLHFDKLNAERLPNVIRLDASATYQFGKANRHWKIGLSVYNLLNRKNIIDKDFILETPPPNEPQTDFSFQELNRYAAGVAPNFFLQYEW